MRHYAALLLAVLGAGCWQEAASQSYDEAIYVENGMPWRGQYGYIDYCQPDSVRNHTFAYALEFKYDDLDDLDFIGGDSVKLYCRDDAGDTTGYITSLQGTHGEWQGIRSCPENEYFIGFRLRVYPEQGTFGDDFAVDNIQLACSDGTVVDGLDGVTPPPPYLGNPRDEEDDTAVHRAWVKMIGHRLEAVSLHAGPDARLNGNWGAWAYCSQGLYVMAIRTVVDEGSVGDDAGLTDVILYCSSP
ncbi:uncharacterized protein LOC126980329 isoform X2 [Eriocheir sinensis]|uniref:uncharacterized protein LOC126980329 isoform X2 n=1 Tax=Eriocheir sinensis TaxID=95602 RepID=UPI0021C8AB44|nr:uncharacterized protein LOC126980329 isoform X2 [Eriocheir sinensis]